MSMGIRSFLTWLQRRSGKDAVFVRSLFNGAAEPTSTALARIHQLAKKWVSALEAGGKLSPGSITHYARRLRWALRLLGERFPKRFPTVPKGFLKRKEHVSGNHESLGDQDWPELEGLTGAARERAALNTVRREALAHFEELEKLFWFGQDLISSETPPDSIGDPNAWIAVKGRIQNALDTGSNRRERSGLGSGSISDPQVWRDAGLDVDVSRRRPLVLRRVSKLVDFCLAPTLDLCHLVAVIFCCATGWNRQPIFDIARDPFLLETRNKIGVTTASFFSEMKRRAGHEVVAHLDSGKHLSPLELENVKSVIRATELEYKQYDNGAFEELDADGEALDVLRRFKRIVDNIPLKVALQNSEDQLFLYRANSKFALASRSKKALSSLKLFERTGIDYPAIRKTVIGLRLRRVGSVEAMSALATHTGTGVLMPHYVNTDENTATYSEKIRFVHNNIQAILLRNRKKLRIRLSLPDADVDWYLQMAKISGIGAAMLPITVKRSPGEATYDLDPTPDNLLSLYLIMFSLVRQRLSGFDLTRWHIQGRPQLALARGMKLALIKCGLGAAWRHEAKRGFRGLKEGTLRLPVLLWA
ncbi:hypothetical protein [Rhizobium subbaraonis]|nr:hypothetical protein [Rhizobium subbaraonis]